MDRWTLPFAVAAALWAQGHPEPARAPSPSALDNARLAASALPPPRAPSPAPAAASPAAFECLARNIYYEARGESPEGQLAVAYVTLNRVAEDGFPDTICGVVHQQVGVSGGCQFGWVCAGRRRPRESAEWKAAQAAARRALAGARDPTHGALYFLRAGERPGWAARAVGRVVIGRHAFFRLAGAATVEN